MNKDGCKSSLFRLWLVIGVTLLWCLGNLTLGSRLAFKRKQSPKKKQSGQIAQDLLFIAILSLTLLRHMFEIWANVRAYRYRRETPNYISVWPVIVSITAGQFAFAMLLLRLETAFRGSLYAVSEYRLKQYAIALALNFILSTILYTAYAFDFRHHLMIFYIMSSVLILYFSMFYGMISHELGTRLVALVSRRNAADSKSERTTQIVRSVTPIAGRIHTPPMEIFDIIEEAGGTTIDEAGSTQTITPRQSLDRSFATVAGSSHFSAFPAFEATNSNNKNTGQKNCKEKDSMDMSPIHGSIKPSTLPNPSSLNRTSPSLTPQRRPLEKKKTPAAIKLGLTPLSLVNHNSNSRVYSKSEINVSERRASIIDQVRASSLREFDASDQEILKIAVKQGVILIGLAISVIIGSAGILVRAHKPYCLGYQTVIASCVTGFSLLMFDLCLYLSFGYSNSDYLLLCQRFDHMFQKVLCLHVKYKISRKVGREKDEQRKKKQHSGSNINPSRTHSH